MTPIPHWPGDFTDLGGHRVFVRSVGAGAGADGGRAGGGRSADGEAALCVHGLGGSSRNWTDLMDLLRPDITATALDLPGHGASPPRPDGRYSIKALAQTVAQLLAKQGEKHGPVHLIGNSMGGAVALRAASQRPDLVKSLTLISPALPDSRLRLDLLRFPVISIPGVGEWLVGRYQATVPPEQRVADVFRTCYYDPSQIPPERLAIEVADVKQREQRDKTEDAMKALIGTVRALTAEQALRPGPRSPWRDAASITVPTLVIYGSHDVLVSPRMAGRAATAFKRNAKVLVLPRTGHVAQMECPDIVAAEIMALIKECDA